MADVTGVSGEYTLPANGFTAPDGKQFKAWSVGGVEKAAGDKITVTANTTVTAVWENIPVVTYTVSFDANGGTGTMTDVTGVSGEYTLPANGFTAPDGKQFKAWSVGGVEKAVGDKITVTANTTVTAVWENIPVVTYTVSFAANGGTGTMADVTGVSGEYTLPANGFTAPDGKQFKAWSVGGVEKAVGDKITVTANTTVTAVWENIPVVTYTVSFAANGGTGTMADVTGVSGEYTLPANGFTAPDGKQFKAWSVGGVEKAAGDKITVTANTTVTAVWEDIPVVTYTITFNANGGSVTPASAVTGADGKLTSLPTATRSGSYSFDGWYTAASGGTQITTAYVFSANTIVYAHWTYIGGGGGGGSYYAPVVPDMPMLYRGCTGDAVKTLQDKLNALGYNSGNVDGIFGAKTYAAVTAFQKANSLGVDGIVGKLTWGKLYGISPAMPVETTTVVGRPMVSYGSRGDAVRKLQELLNALGYDCGSVDGIFGSKTKAAVLAFQKANGLGADGIVGPLTWAKLG